MPEPVRVRDDVTLHEYSTYGAYEGLTVLDEPAVDERGDLVPPKYPAVADETPAVPAAPPRPAPSTTGRRANTEEN